MILPTVAAPTPAPGAADAALGRIEARASLLRQLYAVSEPPRRFVSRSELADIVAGRMAERRDELEILGRLYQALGVIGPGTDFYELYAAATAAVVVGMFDAESGELYVAGEDPAELSAAGTLTYAHEFMHALQHQHFGIGDMLDSPELDASADRRAAYVALVEGDAVLVETLYMVNHMTEAEQALVQEGLDVDMSAFLAAPHMVRRMIAFPYSEGARFVYEFLTGGGWDDVDALYDRPPVSTEQVLHPGKYVLGEGPASVEVPVLDGALGAGWTEVGRGTLGEFALMAYLEDLLAPQAAAEAAAGWGGDEYAVYAGPEGETLVVHRHAWDSVPDAGEFLDALEAFTLGRPGAGPSSPAGEDGFLVELGDRAVYAVGSGPATDVVFAPDTEVLRVVAEALGGGAGAPEAPDVGADP